MINKIKKNPSLWKAIRLRFITFIAALGVTYIITGSPIASLGVSTAQQSTSFVIHYFWEENERKNLPKEVKVMPEEYKKQYFHNTILMRHQFNQLHL